METNKYIITDSYLYRFSN